MECYRVCPSAYMGIQNMGRKLRAMICEYCGRDIPGTPLLVRMRKPAPDGGSEVGERRFHDDICYQLYVQDSDENEAAGLAIGDEP